MLALADSDRQSRPRNAVGGGVPVRGRRLFERHTFRSWDTIVRMLDTRLTSAEY